MSIEQLYSKEFQILKNHGRLVDDWSNVYDHCKKEAEIALILSRLLNLTPDNTDKLVKSAILHDWNKRNERESANATGFMAYKESEQKSEEGLLALGVNHVVVDIAHSVGSTDLNTIEQCDDVLKMAMHYIDDITSNTEVVEINERCDRLEKLDRYKQWNEYGRTLYDGLTMFEKQRIVGMKVQNGLEVLIGIEQNSLTSVIKSKL